MFAVLLELSADGTRRCVALRDVVFSPVGLCGSGTAILDGRLSRDRIWFAVRGVDCLDV